jgi:Cutinase/Ig-like domain from next to BRCA1 gene
MLPGVEHHNRHRLDDGGEHARGVAMNMKQLSDRRDSWRIPALRALATMTIAIALATLAVSPADAVGPYPDFTAPRTNNLAGCPRVAIEGFRGSGEAFDDGTLGLGGSVLALYQQLAAPGRLGSGGVGSSAASYPAVPWAIGLNRLDLWLAAANNAYRNIFLNNYPDSVATGENDGASDITHLAVRCPGTKLVVAGFSQGAEVARRVLARLNPSAGTHVAAAVLMGDPTFIPGEPGVVRVGGSQNGRGISWALYGSTITPIQSRYAGKVITACHDNDLVCRGASAGSLTGHNYAPDAGALADFVMSRVSSAPAGYDCVAFVADLTVTDGTSEPAGSTFTKSWRLRNCGTTDRSGLTAVRTDGAFGPTTFAIPRVAPGATADISVAVTAPMASGHYRATYRLRAADGHFADNNFWVDINVTAPVVDRHGVVSYDRMQPGAPYHGYFTSAWQDFVASSNTITYLGATVGEPGLPGGQLVPDRTLTLRLCTDAACTRILGQGNAQIVNYGNSAVDIGDIPVTAGARYYIVWSQPPARDGNTWATYWWAGGTSISVSDQMQAVVRGYNRLP